MEETFAWKKEKFKEWLFAIAFWNFAIKFCFYWKKSVNNFPKWENYLIEIPVYPSKSLELNW